jgi:hypothetical protein
VQPSARRFPLAHDFRARGVASLIGHFKKKLEEFVPSQIGRNGI